MFLSRKDTISTKARDKYRLEKKSTKKFRSYVTQKYMGPVFNEIA